MYKRDLITAEIEKLAQVLARILGFKVELRLDEAKALFADTLANSFGLSIEVLYDPNLSTFKEWIDETNLPPEKLDMLSQFIFNEIDFHENNPDCKILAQKLELIYQVLANKYHTVHLINLDRQKIIQQYF